MIQGPNPVRSGFGQGYVGSIFGVESFRPSWGLSFRPYFIGGSFCPDFWGESFRPNLFILGKQARLAKRREILIFPRTAGNTGNSREILVIPGKYVPLQSVNFKLYHYNMHNYISKAKN